MVEIIFVSHGNYAESMLKSAEMIVGEQENVQVFGLHLGDSVDQLKIEVAGAIEKALANGEVLVLTDMFAGSPFNLTFSLMQKYSFRHITGVNMPMFLEILTSRDGSSAEDLARDVLAKGKESIIDVNQFIEEMGQ